MMTIWPDAGQEGLDVATRGAFQIRKQSGATLELSAAHTGVDPLCRIGPQINQLSRTAARNHAIFTSGGGGLIECAACRGHVAPTDA